jgi:hypothetical protein
MGQDVLRCELFFMFDETYDSDVSLHGVCPVHFSAAIDDHNTIFMSISDHIAIVHKKSVLVHSVHMIYTHGVDNDPKMA